MKATNEEKETPKLMITPIFGHKAVRAWIEFDGYRYVGMGSVATYDGDGKLVDFKIEPTGVTAQFGC